MIVTGEASGDLHGGALAEALLAARPETELLGFGGVSMRKAGVDIRYDIKQLGIVGLIEVLFHLRVILHAFRTAVALLREQIDVLVLIDFPDFNLRLAKVAKRLNIPVVYYVSPQVWAWRSGRIKTIAARVDQMLVILPFEKAIYEAENLSCEFIGHPLLDELDRLKGEKEDCDKDRSEPFPTIALLPGSRKRELLSLLPNMLKAARSLSLDYPGLRIVIPVAPSLPMETVEALVCESGLAVELLPGDVYAAYCRAHVAVVASGTATLQGALAGTPMVVVYRVSWMSYWVGRLLIHLKYMSLVNIIAEEAFLPELVQSQVSERGIARELRLLLESDTARKQMQKKLKVVADALGGPGASRRAAASIFRVLDTQEKKSFPTQDQAVSP